MSKSTIVFVCHSTGGIVARYLLDVHQEAFESKTVGLVLIASPSYGSELADRLGWIARLYNQRLGAQLQWGSWSLKDLDARFSDLLYQRRLPGLRGVEAYENHFVFHRRWLPNKTVVVTEESAGRYFGAPILLRKTNHFTAVKPDSKRHPAHELLVDFWQNQVAAAVPPTATREPDATPRESVPSTDSIHDEPAYTATSLTETAETLAASRQPPSLPEVFAGDLDRDITGRVQRTLFGTISRAIASFLGIVVVGSIVATYGLVRNVRSDRERHLAAVERLGSDLRRDTSLASRLIRFDSLQDVELLDHLEGHAIQRIVQFIQSATPLSTPCQLVTRDDSSRIPRADVQRAVASVRDLQGRARRPEGRFDRLFDKLVNRLSPRLTTPTRQLSLERTELRGSSLLGLDLSGASLRSACLAGSRLDSTLLDRANFDSAQLRSSTLNDATGANVRFNWADLRDADFNGSTFASLQFVGADLSCATFGNARLDSAEFSGALANWAFFGGTTLRAA
ncbi:MAG: pentapeptide repeat-containing protein, partial [Gemmatimonadaceae bacterium]